MNSINWQRLFHREHQARERIISTVQAAVAKLRIVEPPRSIISQQILLEVIAELQQLS